MSGHRRKTTSLKGNEVSVFYEDMPCILARGVFSSGLLAGPRILYENRHSFSCESSLRQSLSLMILSLLFAKTNKKKTLSASNGRFYSAIMQGRKIIMD